LFWLDDSSGDGHYAATIPQHTSWTFVSGKFLAIILISEAL